MQDALAALQVLAGKLGRKPTLVELLRELGAAPAGMPVQGVNDPGYAVHPQIGSALLGDVPSDESLSMALQMDDLTTSNSELLVARQEFIKKLLFGGLLGDPRQGGLLGAGSPGMPPAGGLVPKKGGRRASQLPPEL